MLSNFPWMFRCLTECKGCCYHLHNQPTKILEKRVRFHSHEESSGTGCLPWRLQGFYCSRGLKGDISRRIKGLINTGMTNSQGSTYTQTGQLDSWKCWYSLDIQSLRWHLRQRQGSKWSQAMASSLLWLFTLPIAKTLSAKNARA